MTELVSEQPRPLCATSEPVQFTYAHDGQSWLRRNLIRSVERVSGSDHFKQMYTDWVASGAVGNPFNVALQSLKLRLDLKGTPLSDVPQEGGLLLVANHPFGIADGLALGWLATQLRSNTRILTHSLLCAVPEFRPNLLPVDFDDTAEARRKTARTRQAAAEVLDDGGAVVIFPGGSVATSSRPFTGSAAELPWHSFVGRLATRGGSTVLPVHVHGQNSRLFHLASHVSYSLRVALMFHETRRRIGTDLSMTIGKPLPSGQLAALPRVDVADALRTQCLDLGDADPSDVFRWPSYIRW